ncbi:hypothetical protein [Rheinheimera sp.]|uniref:hypothetical protein n=1 Tax=Rheinheimera sp. TaxID=1869214 RepID=UPI00307E824B
MDQKQITELMQSASIDAIKFVSDFAGVELDFSLESIVQLDQVLAQLKQQHQQKHYTAAELFTLSSILGAYTGEVFIRHRAGHWHYDQSNSAEPYTAVKVNDKDFPFASICYHQIVSRPEMSLSAYFAKASEGIRQ